MFATSHINHLHMELKKSCSSTNNQVKSSIQSKVKNTQMDFLNNSMKHLNLKHIEGIHSLNLKNE